MPPISEWWKFVRTSGFDADWADLGLGDEDLARLEEAIVNDPDAGDVIAGTGGLRKLRFAREGAGKSGGLRVCYALLPNYGVVLLPLVFDKTGKKDLTPQDKKYFKHLLEEFRASLDPE
jgi:hypothetical protein